MKNYADLQSAAELISKTLSTIEPFPIKREAYVDAFSWLDLPRIYLRIPNENELKATYEASKISTVYCNGTKVEPDERGWGKYTFEYDETQQAYTTKVASSSVAFERLVENLGGEYTNNEKIDNTISWKIGENSWLDTHEDNQCTISKNGEFLIAFKPAYKHFTMPEFENLLCVSITIDQKIPAIMITTN